MPLKWKNPSQPIILYSIKIYFKNKHEIVTFSDKLNLREHITSTILLNEVWKTKQNYNTNQEGKIYKNK